MLISVTTEVPSIFLAVNFILFLFLKFFRNFAGAEIRTRYSGTPALNLNNSKVILQYVIRIGKSMKYFSFEVQQIHRGIEQVNEPW